MHGSFLRQVTQLYMQWKRRPIKRSAEQNNPSLLLQHQKLQRNSRHAAGARSPWPCSRLAENKTLGERGALGPPVCGTEALMWPRVAGYLHADEDEDVHYLPPREWVKRYHSRGGRLESPWWKRKRQRYGRRKAAKKFNEFIVTATDGLERIQQCPEQPSLFRRPEPHGSLSGTKTTSSCQGAMWNWRGSKRILVQGSS